MVSGLAPYRGSWSLEQAAHLLRRTTFGPKRAEIYAAVSDGLSTTLDKLLAPPTLPDPPVNHYATFHPEVPVGESWVNKKKLPNNKDGEYRYPSLRGWYWQHLLHHDCNIMARMTMFWANHFGMNDAGEHRSQYRYLQLFNEYGTDNFQRMVERITLEPSMLHFLNGVNNNRWNPNENYARELLERYTIQKGPQVAPGDYLHYTEQDVVALAKALTGWRTNGIWGSDNDTVASYFDANWHDNGDKQLSHRFNDAVITGNGSEEYKDVIQIIFDQAETAKAFCRQLYLFFVYHELSDEVEANVITPLASVLRDNNYAIKPTLRVLFSSEHFYNMAVRGPMIKSPYEFIVSMARPLGGFEHLGYTLNGNSGSLREQYQVGITHHWWANNMGQDYWGVPEVAGWKAYFQSPGFYRNWIGSSTLKERQRLVNDYTNRGIWTRDDSGNYSPKEFDYLAFLDSLAAPSDEHEVVAECSQIFLPRPLTQGQLEYLTEQLISGLEPTEWALQYATYRSSPFNPDVSGPILRRLKTFFRALFSLAEFQLM